MFRVNENYQKLPGSYLFSRIAGKVNAFLQANPDQKVIRLGIGDVTQPLAPAIIDALLNFVTNEELIIPRVCAGSGVRVSPQCDCGK